MVDEPWQPALIYTPRGVGTLWAPPARGDSDGALDLLGRRRAAILAGAGHAGDDEGPRRAAGRVAGRRLRAPRRAAPGRAREAARDGRRVLYARTPAGEQMLRRRGAA